MNKIYDDIAYHAGCVRVVGVVFHEETLTSYNQSYQQRLRLYMWTVLFAEYQ
jgi:hypothetical protein